MVLRIFKMVATRGFLTALECTKFVFGRGSAPDPTGGAYSVPPYPLAGLKGPTFKGKGTEEDSKREGKGRGRVWEGSATFTNSLIRPKNTAVYAYLGVDSDQDKHEKEEERPQR